MKTQKEIDDEIKALKTVRPKIKPRSSFGDDNLAAVDAQIEVLEQDLDSDEIYDAYEDYEGDEYILGVALDARQWIDGESEYDSLATGWPLKEEEPDVTTT
jgi:hypothetical protein